MIYIKTSAFPFSLVLCSAVIVSLPLGRNPKHPSIVSLRLKTLPLPHLTLRLDLGESQEPAAVTMWIRECCAQQRQVRALARVSALSSPETDQLVPMKNGILTSES